MDRSRLGATVGDALVVSFVFGAVLSPPDPFTQLLYVGPAFVVALSALRLFGERSVTPWWRRYLLFVGGVAAVGLAWQVTAFALGLESPSGVRFAFTLAGVVFAAWLAYFGGLARLRGSDSSAE